MISARRAFSEIRVYTGVRAWRLRANHAAAMPDRAMLLLPPGDPPEIYSWPVVGYEVLVIDTGGTPENMLRKLAYRLLCDGARVVRIVDTTKGALAIFRNDEGRYAA